MTYERDASDKSIAQARLKVPGLAEHTWVILQRLLTDHLSSRPLTPGELATLADKVLCTLEEPPSADKTPTP